MSLNGAEKLDIIKQYKRSENDTGTSEVQVALITSRIQYLTQHFKLHKKDFHSKRGLQELVNKRRKLLKYLKSRSQDRYLALIQSLGLRDSY